MTSEQRQYLKREIDAHRRVALAESGDRKFRHLAEPSSEDGDGQIHPLLAVGLLVGMTTLLSLALLVEHLAR